MLERRDVKLEAVSQKADIETSSEEYAARFAGEIGKYLLSIQEKITIDLLKRWPKTKILDIGGGHAQIAVPLVGSGYSVTIAGSNESCRERLDKLLSSDSFKYLSGNLLSLPFEDKSFDVVISFRLLTHEDNWQMQIREFCRVAKEAVIIDYPDSRSFNIFYNVFFNLKKKFEGNTRTFRTFTRKEIIKEFQKEGFNVDEIKPEFFLPMVVHRMINKVSVLKKAEKIFRKLGLTKLFGSPIILRAISIK